MACSCSALPPYWVGNLLSFAFQQVDCLLQMTGNIAQKAKQLQIFYITFAFQIKKKKKEAKKSYFKIATGASCYRSGWCFTWSLGQSSVRIKLKPRPKLNPRFYVIESQETPSGRYQRCSEAVRLLFWLLMEQAPQPMLRELWALCSGTQQEGSGKQKCLAPAEPALGQQAHSEQPIAPIACVAVSVRGASGAWVRSGCWHHEILGESCRQKYGKNLHSHQAISGCPWVHTYEGTELCYVCHHVQSMFWEHIWSRGQLKAFSF